MLSKLRPIGNSLGLTLPASELKTLNAQSGDLVEIQIIRVVRHAREGWDDPKQWAGVAEESLHLDTLPDNDFDSDGDWQW